MLPCGMPRSQSQVSDGCHYCCGCAGCGTGCSVSQLLLVLVDQVINGGVATVVHVMGTIIKGEEHQQVHEAQIRQQETTLRGAGLMSVGEY